MAKGQQSIQQIASMREIILGTAGHVDHGKTSLIRALTGIETDRLKEEKARGITIDLGFAYLPAPDGTVPAPAADMLWELTAGSGRIARISDADPGLLRYLASVGVVLDARVEVVERRCRTVYSEYDAVVAEPRLLVRPARHPGPRPRYYR